MVDEVDISKLTDKVFSISSVSDQNAVALELFRFQRRNSEVYGQFVENLGIDDVKQVEEIPYLPIEFFKTHPVISGSGDPEITFSSSGTTGAATSKHHVLNLDLYRRSFLEAFTMFYGAPEDYCVLGLLPSYLEREGSSLIYMVDELIKLSGDDNSGFYLDDMDRLVTQLEDNEKSGKKTLLVGVSFALLDLAENHPMKLRNTIVMETGGMKGRRKELVREELHAILQGGLGVDQVHSEYGMTELLSQAYSKGQGVFMTPPWMHVSVRELNDPFNEVSNGVTGSINIMDLANIHSCAFISTQDLGKKHASGDFEVLGRYDHSDVRGCNLLL